MSDPETYTVQFTGQDSYARGRTAFIGIGDYVVFLKTNNSDGTCGTPVLVMGFEHIIAHELLGHVSQSRRIGSTISREAGEHVGVHMENQYLRASGARTLRCRY